MSAVDNITWHTFDTREAMVEELTEATCEALLRGMKERGSAAWAVSGGSTPKPLFGAMAEADLPWEDIQVALVDERWVDIGHPRSNEAFMRAALQTGRSAEAMFIGMKTADANVFDAADAVNKRYGQVTAPFDCVLLGLGPDGHTASLFPEAEGLEAAMADDAPVCVPLRAKRSQVTGDELDRMSLSLSAIAAAREVVLMITGDEKKATLERALGEETHLPIVRVAEKVAIKVYWAP